MKRLAKAGLAITVALAGAEAMGCGQSDEGRGMPGAAAGGGPVGGPAIGPCEEGTSRDCHIYLPEHNGVISCFVGEQQCINGSWGKCSDGSVVGKSWADGVVAKAGTGGTDCADNPCDPACKNFDEVPTEGVKAPSGVSIADWTQGSLAALPDALVEKGLKDPCSTSGDCQFDHYCSAPTDGTCGHAPCQAGDAMTNGCSSCVDAVCATNPTCCSGAYAGTCAHDPCDTGASLKPSCDPCVDAICAVEPTCCTDGWDTDCALRVASVCGKTCGGTPSWDATCVNAIAGSCGSFCGADPEDVSGTCETWLPSQTNSACSGIDLTVTVPCEEQIPVCNRGTVDAPAGIKIVHFPADSVVPDGCSPDTSDPDAETCYTDKVIPAGSCANIEGCPGLSGDRFVMVNPVDGSEASECFCDNNWTLFSEGVACGEVSCSAAKSTATMTKVNMFVSIDKSGSMAWNGWDSVMNSLEAFFEDPESAGLGVALRFWPDNSPSNCSHSSCNVNNCAQPLVALGTLTADSAPTDTHEKNLVAKLKAKSPGGGTPTYAALSGAVKWAKNHQATYPDERAIVVLVTDGQPTQCNSNINAIAGVAEDAYLDHDVLTYVIGIDLDTTTKNKLHKIAAAGGTGQALLVPKTLGSGSVNEELVQTLNDIRGQAASCEFDLPNQGQFDPSNVRMTYTNGGGTATVLPQVASAGSCGSGWYYDVPADPTTATLCDNTCTIIQSDLGASLEVEIGCPGAYEVKTYTERYVATCPSGTKVQWGFLTYDSYAPGDSAIAFEARAADSEAALEDATVYSLATATSTPDTQICDYGDAGCPIDLYAQMNADGAARKDILELMVTMRPTSNKVASPVLNTWEVTYSCPYSE